MTASRALHLALVQEQLEMAGWTFTSVPLSTRWVFVASKGYPMQFKAELSGSNRADALAQALHYAVMTDGCEQGAKEATRDTVPAPAMEGDHAAE